MVVAPGKLPGLPGPSVHLTADVATIPMIKAMPMAGRTLFCKPDGTTSLSIAAPPPPFWLAFNLTKALGSNQLHLQLESQ